jgi:hypothetical protein
MLNCIARNLKSVFMSIGLMAASLACCRRLCFSKGAWQRKLAKQENYEFCEYPSKEASANPRLFAKYGQYLKKYHFIIGNWSWLGLDARPFTGKGAGRLPSNSARRQSAVSISSFGALSSHFFGRQVKSRRKPTVLFCCPAPRTLGRCPCSFIGQPQRLPIVS